MFLDNGPTALVNAFMGVAWVWGNIENGLEMDKLNLNHVRQGLLLPPELENWKNKNLKKEIARKTSALERTRVAAEQLELASNYEWRSQFRYNLKNSRLEIPRR